MEVARSAFVSSTGMGVGITGARRLSDRFTIESGESGTQAATARVIAPRPPLDGRDVREIADAMARDEPASPKQELQRTSSALVAALATVRERDTDIEHLAQELAETNRGVVALYAELDDRAVELQRLSATKSR